MFFIKFGSLTQDTLAYSSHNFRLLVFSTILCISGCTFQPIKPPAQPNSSYNRNLALQNSKSLQQANKNTQKEPLARADIKLFKEAVKEPLSPENTQELLDEVGSNWLYGQGMGETAATVGTIVAFPPYALWVVGNAALQLSGEEPIEVSKILPEESGKVWRTTYDEITSVPGRTSAAVAREEYRDQDVAREHIEAVIKKNSDQQKKKRQIDKQQKQSAEQ